MNKFYNQLLVILFFVFASSCTSKFLKIQKSTDIDYKLKMADTYFDNKKYELAQILYESVFPFIKGTARYEEYYYKFALSYYNDKDYLNAENLFKTFLENFPESKNAEDAEYLRAYCYYKQSPKAELDQTNTHKAINLFQAFLYARPNSSKDSLITELMTNLKLKLEDKDKKSAFVYYNLELYKASSVAFTTLSENYPDSKFADEYKYWVIVSLNQYTLTSLPEKQLDRNLKTLEEIKDFEERFQDSKYMSEVLNIKNKATILKNTKIQIYE